MAEQRKKPIFASLSTAGEQLAEKLLAYKNSDAVVLAIPREGVATGFEVAKRLLLPLDILSVRTLHSPVQQDMEIGAIAERNVTVVDENAIDTAGTAASELEFVLGQEQSEMNRRIFNYRNDRSLEYLKGQTVLVVDMGLTTGYVAKAAVRALRALEVRQAVLAVPVCSTQALEMVRDEFDDIVCVASQKSVQDITQFYEDFSPFTDDEVIALLKRAKTEIPKELKGQIAQKHAKMDQTLPILENKSGITGFRESD